MSSRVSFIEIKLKKCTREYSVAPCTAAIGTTGSQKCFNSRATCQDRPNLNETEETLRYSIASTNVPFDIDAVPNIASIDYQPPVLDLGKSIGVRATLTVVFKDHQSPDTDPSGDPYIISRTYDPWYQGTYWGKFKARHPFMRGQEITWIQGATDQSIESMERRTFVIESMSGPDASGMFKITAKDVLKLADGDRSVAPRITNKPLDFDISDSFTGIIFSVNDDNPIYPELLENEYLALGESEIVKYTRQGVQDGVIISISQRGQLNTVAKAHSADDNLQIVRSYVAAKASTILYDLLVTYSGVSPSFISLPDWENEADTFLNRAYTAHIARPTAVKTLINELIEQTASSMWWDNQALQIRWQVLRLPSAANALYTDSLIDKGSFNVSDQPEKRVSQVYVSFGLRNPLAKLDDPQNYVATTLRTELESEDDWNAVPAYKNIFSRWIPDVGKDIADRLGDLILQRYSQPPRKVGFRLMRDTGAEIPDLAGSYNLSSQPLQMPDGSLAVVPIQITSLKPMNVFYTIVAEEIKYNSIITPENPDVFNVIFSSNTNNINLRTEFNKFGVAPNATTIVNVLVESGIIIGSNSIGTPAMVTGDWPAGATINVVNRGWIVGRGGAGGNGGNSPEWFAATNGFSGETGGDALTATFDISLDNQGVIGGGGGGGGGGGAAHERRSLFVPNRGRRQIRAGMSGNGGSGGAGILITSGGSGGSSSLSTSSSYFAGQGISGQAGSQQSGGASALAASVTGTHQDLVNGQLATVAIHRAFSGRGGAGGALGQAGSTGGQGSFSIETFNGAFTDTVVNQLTNGGNPGNPGRAIVQSGGTITFINAGDIRGAIV